MIDNFKHLSENNIRNNSLHTLSPYIGRMRASCAKRLIEEYAIDGQPIYDPFCGSGTILLEGWGCGYEVIGSDLNKYAYVLSKGKTHPFSSEKLAHERLKKYNEYIIESSSEVSVEQVPDWVRSFYHPETLNETLAWFSLLSKNNEWFLLSCLMGILHHQRPGFLSYPSSHSAPYLRTNKFPRGDFPEMYEYRNVYTRLQSKITRSYKTIPKLDFTIDRTVYHADSSKLDLKSKRVATIITSPPYMKALTYARDNRLRLWFLGEDNWKDLDKQISPQKNKFLEMMERCFYKWSIHQDKNDKCIIVIGDIPIKHDDKTIELAELLIHMASPYYILYEKYYDPIPEYKKQIKGSSSIKQETVIVLERKE